MLKSKSISLVFFFIFTLIAVVFLYRDGLSSYFFQDDWFTFRIAQASNLKDFLNFFIPRDDIIYYRPLGMQLPFFLLRSFFGLNPLPFKILILLTHLINSLLVFLICLKLIKDRAVSLLISFLYAVSSVHYIIFYWSSTFPFMLGPLFFFASFLSFLKDDQNNERKSLLLSYFFYFFGLLVNEIIISLPLILTAYVLFFTGRKKLYRLTFFYLLPLGFLAVRILLFPPPFQGNYALGLGRQTLINLRDYFFWTFNFPEETRNQFVSFLGINRTYLRDFGSYYLNNILSMLMTILFLIFIPFLKLIRKTAKQTVIFLFFSLIWYLAALIPVILFSGHTFTYYLPLSLFGLLIGSGFLLAGLRGQFVKKRYLFYFYLGLTAFFWLWGSFWTVKFNDKVHWAPRRGRISLDLVQKAAGLEAGPSAGTVFFVRDDPEFKLALNDQDGLKVFLKREDIITRYLKEPGLDIQR